MITNPFSPLSLRLRLTLFISVVTIVIFLLTSGFVERSVEQHFIEQDVAELNNIYHAIDDVIAKHPAPKIADSSHIETLQIEIQAILSNYPNQYAVLLWDNKTQSVIYQSQKMLDWPAVLQQKSAKRVQIWQQETQNYRLITEKTTYPRENPLTILIATPINFHLHYIHELQTTFLIITIISSIILLIAAWIAVYQGHAPLRQLSQHIANLTTDQLDTRLTPSDYPVELQALTQSFNRLMARIEDVFQRQANFSADIAHEIRTPITNLTTQTQIVLSQPRDKEAYREILYSSLEEYERMRKMVNEMLFLAQADSQLLSLDLSVIDLKKEWLILFDDFGAWAEEQHLRLALTGETQPILGDRAMLRRALSNLLSNAIQHTSANQTICVHLAVISAGKSAEKRVEIQITNPHPPIPKAQLDHFFDRFYRADPARQRRSDSSGIGLAIVKSIIQIHGGTIAVSSNQNAITFTLNLPLIPDKKMENPRSRAQK